MSSISLRSTISTLLQTRYPKPDTPNSTRFKPTYPIKSINWDHVLQTASLNDKNPSNLNGFIDKVRNCNRGSELKIEFVPFMVEDETVGYIHNGFAENLKKFEDVFSIVPKRHVRLHSSLTSPDDRTEAVGEVIKSLGNLIPGIRNELYPVTSSFGKEALFSLERAAAPFFGIKAYGVHMNGYVDRNGQRLLWIGKRSDFKPTYPGMLDHLVAGGLPHGISCKENLMKECQEEAGIPRSISDNAISVGAVSYMDIDGYRYKRDVLFCYDLKLPEDFVPNNEDGEVDSFKLVPLTQVANIIRTSYLFKPNCCLVIIDFLFRHGCINPDDCGYLDLLQSLRSGS